MVKTVSTDRLCHQSTTAPTQLKRNSKALQCPGISPTLWEEAACYIHVLSYNSSGIVAFCTTSLLILLLHVSILYGPIEVLSGIVILNKYFVSVGIHVFAILLDENVLIYLRYRLEILEKI